MELRNTKLVHIFSLLSGISYREMTVLSTIVSPGSHAVNKRDNISCLREDYTPVTRL